MSAWVLNNMRLDFPYDVRILKARANAALSFRMSSLIFCTFGSTRIHAERSSLGSPLLSMTVSS